MPLAAERVAIRDCGGERDACPVECCRQPARDLAQTGLGLEEADDVDARRRGLGSRNVRREVPLGGLGALTHVRSARSARRPRRRDELSVSVERLGAVARDRLLEEPPRRPVLGRVRGMP